MKNRTPVLTAAVLTAIALTGSCILFQKRPWSSDSERTHFMLKMTAELIAPVPNYCIDELHRQLNKHVAGAPRNLDLHFKRVAMSGAPMEKTSNDFPTPKIVLIQAPAKSEGGRCEQALASCGNCHLPKKNNCTYDIIYDLSEDEKSRRRIRGKVIGVKDGKLLVAAQGTGDGDARLRRIPVKSIHKSVWLNGADPLHTWWDFKSFGRKGKTAAHMLEIAATHGVACTNCHVRHGDFRLTKEGRVFAKTGKVIKRVPIEKFKRR